MSQSIISLMQQAMANSQIIDLSYTLEPNMPVWPTHSRFGAVVYEDHATGSEFMQRQILLGEHNGTHIDAPRHYIPTGATIDELPVNAVMGRGVKIDATWLKPCEPFTLPMLQAFEEKYGAIKEGDIVMLSVGWEDKYGLGKDNEEYLKDWPGLGSDAAKYLMEKKVACVGTDALSLDPYGNDFSCHDILLGNNIYIMENIKNLKKLPVHSFVIGLQNKFKGGSGSPIRLVAFIDK